jgi:hypothetical protein
MSLNYTLVFFNFSILKNESINIHSHFIMLNCLDSEEDERLNFTKISQNVKRIY